VRTRVQLIGLLTEMVAALKSGDDEMADRCGIELAEKLEGIDSSEEIVAYLRRQANLRSQENDFAGALLKAASQLKRDAAELEG
jgi:hypothetical protein